MEFEGKEGYFEYGTQQTSKRLQEYGVDSLEAVERIGGL